MQPTDDTIAAIATAPGDAGIAVIRISGSQAFAIADRVFRGPQRPSAMTAGTFLHGVAHRPDQPDERLDDVLLLKFQAPGSYTGEDVIEIQGHGGRVTAKRLLRAVLDGGARAAVPGEFTRRAFLNGKIDLVQAEAVCDLIRAQSDRAAASALEQLNGFISNSIGTIYDESLILCADLEATLDFSEEELPPSVWDNLRERLQACLRSLSALLETWEEGQILREGVRVVISGQPNVGKSTLMNAMLRRDRSIVSETPGTTRDTIEEPLVIHGVPVRLVDTAGLREADCAVEREGVRRAKSALAAADLVLFVLDGSQPIQPGDMAQMAGLDAAHSLVVVSKADLGVSIQDSDIPAPLQRLTISLLAPNAAETIREALGALLGIQGEAGPHAAISERHRDLLLAARAELLAAIQIVDRRDVDGGLLAAQHLREALESLGLITGREYSESLLDTIFGRFCIGK